MAIRLIARNISILLICLSAALSAMGQKQMVHVRGVVRDSITKAPVPYTAIFLRGTDNGGISDEKGHFDVATSKPFTLVQASAMGYTTKSVPARRGISSDIIIELSPTGVLLNEVIIKPKKEKYSKKNNPAVDFVNKIRNSQNTTNPRRNDYYSYDKYDRITVALNDFHPDSKKNLILKKFKFLSEFVDTSEVTGRPILNLSTREKASTVYYRKQPAAEKQYTQAKKAIGIDDFMDQDNLRLFVEDVLREIDLYSGSVTVCQNRFVSPLSSIAPDFYKFYLTDTVPVGGEQCVELSFVPHNSQSMGFTGKVFIPVGDSTMFIKKVEMNVPKEINLNFVKRLYLEQEYVKASDGSRLKVRDDMTADIEMIPGVQPFYARRNTSYANHSFDSIPAGKFDVLGYEIMCDSADLHTEEFWEDHRFIPISDNERNVDKMAQRLRRHPFYFWTEKFMKIMLNGYVGTGKDSKFDIGPLNTLVSHNDLEGLRLRVGGLTTANLMPRLFLRGYTAYGFKDHKWKYMGEVEYSFRERKYTAREFPIHSLRLTHLYDVDMLGQHLAYANNDNSFLSFRRMKDHQITYHRVTDLTYTLELDNHFSVEATAKTERQYATDYMTFIDGHHRMFDHFNETSLSVKLRYAPGEKFYQTKTHRYHINSDAPIVYISHEYAPKKTFGNAFAVNRTEIGVENRFWFSAFGYADVWIRGGHVWSKSPYPYLLIPNANLSYTVQLGSFSLMNPLEFINDSYAEWNVTYHANGTVMNYLPLIRKLKLREVFSFKGLFGHLSKRNNPAYNPDLYSFPEISHTMPMTSTPYMEVSVGLENIFRILRVDYVWRLTYLDRPNIDKGGLRVGLYISF